MRRLLAFAPPLMWLFWLLGAGVIAAGLHRGGEPQPRFLVATGDAVEVWHGARRETTLLKLGDRSILLDAAFSPDGRLLAIARLTPPPLDPKADVGVDLFVANRDGSDLRLVLQHSAYGEFIDSLVWLPGGSEVAYGIVTPRADESVDQRIEAIDVATGRRRRLLDNAGEPSLAPGDNALLVRVQDGAYGEQPRVYDLANGTAADLAGYARELRYLGAFARSPDGRQIAFGAADATVRIAGGSGPRAMALSSLHPILQDVWLMAANGDDLRRLADLAVNQPSITWSQDGLFVYAVAPTGFWRIDARTGAYRRIGPGLQSGRIRPFTPAPPAAPCTRSCR